MRVCVRLACVKFGVGGPSLSFFSLLLFSPVPRLNEAKKIIADLSMEQTSGDAVSEQKSGDMWFAERCDVGALKHFKAGAPDLRPFLHLDSPSCGAAPVSAHSG
ncbi:uncharacterized protein BKA78DRAFT_33826 [Phyllosticta capitalensis]|uniref:uncharacterized protein n=1 Tax=Phyllosticta capitalensis TaxID=121624 RepID=UPI00312D9370